MGALSWAKKQASDALGAVGDTFDFGASEAAEEQSAASKEALKQQAREAQKARDFLQSQAAKGVNFIDQGTTQAAGAIADNYGQALGAQNSALGGQMGAYGDAYGQAVGDIQGGTQSALNYVEGGTEMGRADINATQNRMGDLYGGGLAAGFETDPGYQFRLSQGQDAINHAASAAGGRHGGDTLKALAEYNQNFASNEFNNYANRTMGMAQGADQNDFNKNAALAGLASQYGQSSAGISQQGGQSEAGLATLYGQQQGDAYGQWGQQQSGTMMGQGAGLADIYSQAGANKANVSIGAAGQNTGISQSLMNAYGAPVQYAGGAQAAQGQGAMNALMLAGYFCDARLKTDPAPGADAVEEMLAALRPLVYRYRDEAHGVGEHLGFMAQDAEQSEIGRWIVSDTPAGKVVDLRRVAVAALAAAAHERTKRLELERRIARLEEALG